MNKHHGLLQAWLEAERRSQAWLASKLDVHQTSVSAWCRGRSPIPLAAALQISAITGIKVEHLALDFRSRGAA